MKSFAIASALVALVFGITFQAVDGAHDEIRFQAARQFIDAVGLKPLSTATITQPQKVASN